MAIETVRMCLCAYVCWILIWTGCK